MRPEQRVPPDVPRTLLEELDRRDARITKHATEGHRTYLWLDAEGGPLFARVSTDPIDIAVFEHEVTTREVVGRREPMRVPAVLARDASWLLEEAVDGRPLAGRADLRLAIEAAATISTLTLPEAPPAPVETRWLRIRRRLRLLRFPTLLLELRRAQRILRAPELPAVTSHGDFHPGNLLVTGTSLYVFDWEMVGLRPAGHDLLQLWASQAAPEDRDYVFAGALELVGDEHRSALERLRYAVLVETAAIKVSTALPVSRDLKGARRLLSLLPAVRPRDHDPAG